MRRLTRSILRTYLIALTITSVLAISVRTWVLEPYRIPHSRMQPSLLPGDYVLVYKPGYSWAKSLPQEGEILLVRAEGSTFKVELAEVTAASPEGIRIRPGSPPTPEREIAPEDVLGRAWRIWLSIEPKHGAGSEVKSWVSRLRFERFFLKVGM